MLDIVIDQTAFCALIGFVLSIVIAAAASQPLRVEPQSILIRLVLAAVPGYLAVDYLVYQGPAMSVVAAALCALGLYCLRGWWLPRPSADAAIEYRSPAARPHQAELLRFRIETVVRADRGYPHAYMAEPRSKAA